ncbi:MULTISPECIES: type II toxin-antitoxin system RelE/ParE family toxin [Vibrio]|uniref:type II toxin-antitoxin system RelE/ParE family toxin n=1 Tax=Vibrio TaxID=662 RepID=UPI000587CE10|nr:MULTISPECIES: type II toxin-antitoxin system RelE/ParE family toxin [Vibrio]AXN34735.1 diaminopimelate decarboxylase [Vibrio coralliilyticus]KPH25076.1 diaminopimelate decarboxylase [Vibrio coralliilyticus]MCC2524348.1 type II toxin-antitoxin system RelE/ParE family toxin [Vibrio coralliilyticus]MDE3898405.1 type II toxin-antitoxin system RelE/ParE family toxin [Vibrio sp. CC007]PAU35997.1 diaminopimelate decarboxylase [Vibrio coralliilyticus]
MFKEWFSGLDETDQIEVRACIDVLREYGPTLRRPRVGKINGSAHPNMKELVVQSQGNPIRIFFAFDPNRTGILLCGGDKSNQKRFYKEQSKIADKEYSDHLKGE